MTTLVDIQKVLKGKIVPEHEALTQRFSFHSLKAIKNIPVDRLEAMDRWGVNAEMFSLVETTPGLNKDDFWSVVEDFFLEFQIESRFGMRWEETVVIDRYFHHWVSLTGLTPDQVFFLRCLPAVDDFTVIEVVPVLARMSFDEMVANVISGVPMPVMAEAVNNNVDGDLLRSLNEGAVV